MNKNIIKLFAILVMIFMVGAVLVGCAGKDGADGADGVDGKPGENGAPGKDGQNAIICETHDWNKETFTIKDHKYDANTGVANIGSYLRVCDECGWAEIFMEDHDFVEAVTLPTCLDEGYTTLTCSICAYTTIDAESIVNALGHEKPAFDANDPTASGKWTLVSDPTGICPCEYVAQFNGECNRCGAADEFAAEIPAAGHAFTVWETTLDNTGLPPCKTTPVEVSECDNCDDGCYKSRNAKDDTPDHNWSAWIITEAVTTTSAGKAVRTCATCANDYPDFGIEEVTLTALAKDNADYTYACTQESNCINDEKGTFTHKETGVQIKNVVVAGKSGHDINGADYEVVKPTKVTPGAVNVECNDCDEVITYVLPVVSNKAAYDSVEIKDYAADGKETPLCQDIEDTYTITFNGDDVNVKGSITVTFDFDGDYVHSDRPAMEDCVFSPGDADDECDYYIYKCEDCGHWIVAYEVAKA